MTSILWFKRDLRVSDHAALAQAVERGPVVPVYIVEPEYWALPDTSARQWDFTGESVQSLATDLGALGVPLIIRVGEALEVLRGLAAQSHARRLISHEETGNAWTFARDRAVAAWARQAGLDWVELPQSGVQRRMASRDGWATRREGYVRSAKVPTPKAVQGVSGLSSDRLPTAQDLGMQTDPCPGRQTGGRGQGVALIESFLAERGQGYRKAMSSPVAGEWACSRISAHLALGCISGREAVQAAGLRQAEVKGQRTGWSGSLSSFQARLAWRDHFMQKLEDAPQIETHCLHSAYENLRPRDSDPARLRAWELGETGLPFVDACMRYLCATGWLNFRMRSMLMAVASYHLWLDWRSTGPHLARMFTDYEPGIHWSQVQMQSGTTGMNTVRVYNPVKQGHDQDPTGAFTRRWVPELAEVPDAHLQEPWTWEGAGRLLGKTYPEPLVEVKAAAKEAQARVWAVRRGAAFRTEAAQIVKKHASRKEPGVPMRFQRDQKTAATGPEQLKLDL